jgi:hypothetical protein
MATPGYIDLPSSNHFTFEYNNQLNSDIARAIGKALLDTAEQNFNTLSSWFGGVIPTGTPFLVKINLGGGGGSNDNIKNINLTVGATTNFNYCRFVLVAEVSEIFMRAAGSHWHSGDSSGEGLSQLTAFMLYPDQVGVLNGPEVWLNTSINPSPEKPARPDFVAKTEPSDNNFVSFGCALLFLYYLRSQLGFNISPIIRAAADSLEGVYINLTQDSKPFQNFSPFQKFMGIIEKRFPLGKAADISGSTDPFPLPAVGRLSAKHFLTKNEMDLKLLGQTIRANRYLGNLRALLNSDRRASLA